MLRVSVRKVVAFQGRLAEVYLLVIYVNFGLFIHVLLGKNRPLQSLVLALLHHCFICFVAYLLDWGGFSEGGRKWFGDSRFRIMLG